MESPPFFSDNEKIVEESPMKRFARFNEEIGRGACKIVYKGIDVIEMKEIAWNSIYTKKLSINEKKRLLFEIEKNKTKATTVSNLQSDLDDVKREENNLRSLEEENKHLKESINTISEEVGNHMLIFTIT